jgi:hypothetical protein
MNTDSMSIHTIKGITRYMAAPIDEENLLSKLSRQPLRKNTTGKSGSNNEIIVIHYSSIPFINLISFSCKSE